MYKSDYIGHSDQIYSGWMAQDRMGHYMHTPGEDSRPKQNVLSSLHVNLYYYSLTLSFTMKSPEKTVLTVLYLILYLLPRATILHSVVRN